MTYNTVVGIGDCGRSKMKSMFYYDREKECSYLQFKYLGHINDLNNIKDDVKEFMFYLGHSMVDAAPSFRYYISNEKILELMPEEKFDKINIYLRSLKLKMLTGDYTTEEKSNLKFINFFMDSFEKNLIVDANVKELM